MRLMSAPLPVLPRYHQLWKRPVLLNCETHQNCYLQVPSAPVCLRFDSRRVYEKEPCLKDNRCVLNVFVSEPELAITQYGVSSSSSACKTQTVRYMSTFFAPRDRTTSKPGSISHHVRKVRKVKMHVLDARTTMFSGHVCASSFPPIRIRHRKAYGKYFRSQGSRDSGAADGST